MGYPPPPDPLKTLDWRGLCKNGLQNLEGVVVRGQNLDLKGLTDYFNHGVHTAFALAMICSFRLRGKVGCHNGPVEIAYAYSEMVLRRDGKQTRWPVDIDTLIAYSLVVYPNSVLYGIRRKRRLLRVICRAI